MPQFGVHWVTRAQRSVLRQSARLCSFERTRRSVSFIKVVEAANIAPAVVTVRSLGSGEFEKVSGGSLRLSLQQKMLEANHRQSSIRIIGSYVLFA
jgi:hypothetical protein